MRCSSEQAAHDARVTSQMQPTEGITQRLVEKTEPGSADTRGWDLKRTPSASD
jgi:hypothetical protein